MAEVVIYTGMLCGYCAAAKRLLGTKGAEFKEINVTLNAEERNRMLELSNGARTVPQIFIGGIHIGGCDELYALDNNGELDLLLAGGSTKN
jgi:glutaredoxin 3